MVVAQLLLICGDYLTTKCIGGLLERIPCKLPPLELGVEGLTWGSQRWLKITISVGELISLLIRLLLCLRRPKNLCLLSSPYFSFSSLARLASIECLE